jgi:uncharacterized membrane protein YfcA
VSSILELLWLVPLGFIAGGYGTLIGAGGGFILAPSLLLIYPDEAPETLTVISLCVVFFNSLSGTLAYLRSGRIDFKAGVIFALATMPGAVAGALTTAAISRARFNLLFGILLIIVAAFLVLTPRRANAVAMAHSGRDAKRRPNLATMMIGAAVSTCFGFISSFLGIGGGFLYVPSLVYLLKFSVHIATATSLFVLTLTSLTGSITHFAAGLFDQEFHQAIGLSIGAMAGAQVAARVSQRIHGALIMRSLAVALALVGSRLVALAL